MRRRNPIQIRSWALPLLVAALIVPTVAGFRLAGPGLGLAAGALSVAALIVVAGNLTYDERIEVAEEPGDRYRVMLVLAGEALDEPIAANGVAAIAEHGKPESGKGREPEVLVLAPAVAPAISRWANDVTEARLEAQTRLALTVGTLAAAGIDARGQVGDPDSRLAIEDALRVYPAQEVVFADPRDPAIEDVRRRLDRPVRTLT